MLIFSKFSFRFPEESFYSKCKASQNGSGKDEDPGNASGKTVKKKSVQDLPQGLDTLGKSACIGGNLSHHISRSQPLDKGGGKKWKNHRQPAGAAQKTTPGFHIGYKDSLIEGIKFPAG